MNQLKRAVVTGLGVLAPNGTGLSSFWQACLQGRSGIVPVSTFDTSSFKTHIAGEVKNFGPEDFLPAQTAKRVDRFVHLGLAAAVMAVTDSGLNLDEPDKTRWGAIIGSGLGGLMWHEEGMAQWLNNGRKRANPIGVARVTPNAVSSHLAIHFGLLGPNGVIATSCASGTQGIGEAYRKIQTGDANLIIAGGTEAPLTPYNFASYNALRVMSRRKCPPQEASCPFDLHRDGFVMGEGAAMLVMEELNHALQRNARIYGEICGYGLTCGAYNMVIPKPDGEDAARAMKLALADAQLEPEALGYLNAHGTGTQANDSIETQAIKATFGERAHSLPISSLKSMIGHCLGAAGAIEAAACCMALKDQRIPPTINYRQPDPKCDLDYVPNRARNLSFTAAMSNSFGFGGINACIVIKKYDDRSSPE